MSIIDKVVDARLWTFTTQNSTLDTRLTMGDSAANAFTRRDNRLRGTLMWDSCMYVLHDVAVAGGPTGGSYSVSITTDAVKGYTGLPIASVTGFGPLSPASVVLDNLHQSPSSPRPTHISITQVASGGGLTFKCNALAKQYRGVLGTPGGTAERVLEGNMIVGGDAGPFTGGAGMFESTTFTLGTSGTNLGMHRMRHWDHAMFWVVAGVSLDGAHDVDIVAEIEGDTVSIASTGTGGALNVAGEKVALANAFYGQCPNPTQIIWTEETGTDGVSDARVVMLAKSGRGSLAKR